MNFLGDVADNKRNDLFPLLISLGFPSKRHKLRSGWEGQLIQLNPRIALFKYGSNGNVVLLCRAHRNRPFSLLVTEVLDLPRT